VRIATSTLAWSLGTVLAAAAAAWLVSRNPPPIAIPIEDTLAEAPSEQSFHVWLHANLAITDAQHEALLPHETSFENERLRLREEIKQAGAQLALAIQKAGSDNPEVESALRRLQAAQGELQQVTLNHFFLMKDFLEPAQAERLLKWTHDNLLDGHSN